MAEYSYADVTNYLTELDYGNNGSVKYIYDDQGRTLKQIYGTGHNIYDDKQIICFAVAKGWDQ